MALYIYVSFLELLAAAIAVKTFLNNQVDRTVLLLINNQPGVAYISNLSGTISAQAMILARAYGHGAYKERINSPGIVPPWSGELTGR